MSPKIALRIASFFVIFTFIGHTFGHFAPTPPTETKLIELEKSMSDTLVPMPMGPPKSVEQIMDGLDLTLSVYLLITGIILILLSNQPLTGSSRGILILT